jgi:hypothetical protein
LPSRRKAATRRICLQKFNRIKSWKNKKGRLRECRSVSKIQSNWEWTKKAARRRIRIKNLIGIQRFNRIENWQSNLIESLSTGKAARRTTRLQKFNQTWNRQKRLRECRSVSKIQSNLESTKKRQGEGGCVSKIWSVSNNSIDLLRRSTCQKTTPGKRYDETTTRSNGKDLNFLGSDVKEQWRIEIDFRHESAYVHNN